MIKAYGENVLVKPEKPTESTTSSGLIVNTAAAGNLKIGTVVSFGSGVSGLKKKDRAHYPGGVGREILISGVPHEVIKEKDIIAIEND
jgi:co-chaperonin GroES (HSP10)